jgi:hypothetical protein
MAMKKVNGHLWPGEPPEDTDLQTVPKEVYDAAVGKLRENGLDVPEANIHTEPAQGPPPFLVAKPGEKQPGDEEKKKE